MEGKSMSNLKVCKKCKANSMGAFNGYWPYLEENYNICKECGGFLESTNIDSNDFWIIWNISHDNNFIEAMINLKQKDIIEYELKMSQFRNQVQLKKQQESNVALQTNQPKCPTCNSTNIRKISSTKKAASIIGFGLLSNNIGKTYECKNCGYKW